MQKNLVLATSALSKTDIKFWCFYCDKSRVTHVVMPVEAPVAVPVVTPTDVVLAAFGTSDVGLAIVPGVVPVVAAVVHNLVNVTPGCH